MNCANITTNAGGIALLQSTKTTVGTESVDIALGFRRIQPVGYLTVQITDVIPADTTTTLPVTLTLNGTTRALTLPNASLNGSKTSVISILSESICAAVGVLSIPNLSAVSDFVSSPIVKCMKTESLFDTAG